MRCLPFTPVKPLLYPQFAMAVHHMVEPQLRLVLINLIGIVTNNDLIECQAKLMSNPLFEGNFDRIVDASDAIKFDVTQDVVRAVAKTAVERGMRRAALVGMSDCIYGLMRMYEFYAIGAEVSVFRSLGDAYHWLMTARDREPVAE